MNADDGSKNADAFLALLHLAAKLVPCVQARNAGCVRPLPCDFEDVAKAVVVKSAHRVEVGGERIGVSGLQLLDKALDVGGDDLFRGLPLLRLFGVFAGRGDGAGGGCAVHGCFLLGLWLLHVRVETRHVHAERHLAKAGVARRKGRGISHPWSGAEGGAERAERSGGLHKRSAEDWGNPLRRAIGAEPLSEACLPYWRAAARRIIRVGVAGRNRPAKILSCFTSFSFLFRSVQRDISLYWRERSEIMEPDKPLISVNDLHKRPIQVAHHGLVSDSAILHSSKSRANVGVVSCRDAGFEPLRRIPSASTDAVARRHGS